MIQKLLLKTQMIWMIFVEILKNAVQIKNKHIDCIWWYDCRYAYAYYTILFCSSEKY